MSTGVELNLDLELARSIWADEERQLYARVLQDRDEGAAAILLSKYLQEMLSAPEVEKAIDEGAREVMRYVLTKTTDFRGKANVQPLMYFDPTMKRKPGEKGEDGVAATELLRARRIVGLRLTEDEVREALTTQWDAVNAADNAKPMSLPLANRPKTYGEVEARLIAYLRRRKFKAADAGEAAFHVRDSLPNNPWDKPKTEVVYPDSW